MRSTFVADLFLKRKAEEKCYWHDLPFYKDLLNGKKITFDGPVTFFVGENGSGKSTLIEAIAVAMRYNAEGGSKNISFSTKYTTASLCDEITVSRTGYEKDGYFLRAESFYNVSSEIDNVVSEADWDSLYNVYGGGSLHERSHGESFMTLVENRFFGNGLYILDEPEAALSPARQLTRLSEISRLVKENSQFIISTHSPILLTFPDAVIYKLDSGIERVGYEETDHYLLTKDFLNNPKAYLRHLIS